MIGYSKNCALAILLITVLSGCATKRKTPIPEDPLEPLNRSIYTVNELIDRAAIVPVARTYEALVVPPARSMVGNFFGNLAAPRMFANDLLQGEWHQAAVDTTRFGINSTLGLFGLFDVAAKLDLEREKRDLGQTLGKWGYKRSTYLVLPILGSSTLRDMIGMGGDYVLSPQTYLDDKTETGLYLIQMTHLRADLFAQEAILKESALDSYALVRNAYLQHRAYVIKDDGSPEDDTGADSSDQPKAIEDEYLGEPPE